MNVGRKIQLDALHSMVHNAGLNSIDDLKSGMVLHDPGIVSTSHSEHVWSGTVRFDIKIPQGSKAIDISETINQGEQEVMLPSNSKFKISSVKKDTKSAGGHYQYHIECELIN